MNRSSQGFTLAELLIAVAIVVLLILLVSRIVATTAALTTIGHKRLDADSQARQLFDRMAVDFERFIRRTDVDSYIKGVDSEIGNDRIAFFSHVAGYYPPGASATFDSPITLVAYRVNSDSASSAYMKMERMSKGLLWNGSSTGDIPFVFGPSPTLQSNWPAATNNTTADPDYEVVGPHIFRFEYFYQLKDGTFTNNPGANATSISSISVCIATTDPKSEVLLPSTQLATIATKLNDYSAGNSRGMLLADWRTTLASDSTIAAMPRNAVSAIHLYERDFSLK